MWKYVDDVSTSNNLSGHDVDTTEQDLDDITNWATLNWMKLNHKKCKEIRVCFLRQPPLLTPLTIGNHELEIVTSHKVLGITIQNDLKWGLHTNDIIKKASKRLHILRVLRRAGVPSRELIIICISLV